MAALLAAGAHVDTRDATGKTALIRAVQYGSTTQAVCALLAGGADCNARDHNGMPPLIYAASASFFKGSRLAVVDALLAHGSHVDAATHDGVTPLMAAALDRDQFTVSALLSAGADVHAVDGDGCGIVHRWARGATSGDGLHDSNRATAVALLRAGAHLWSAGDANGSWRTMMPLEALAAVARHKRTSATERTRLVDLALYVAARRVRAHWRLIVNAWAAAQAAMFAAAEAAYGGA